MPELGVAEINKEINILSSEGGTYTGYMRVDAKADSGYIWPGTYWGDGTLRLDRAPVAVPATITFTDLATGQVLTSSPTRVDDLCADDFTQIVVTPPIQADRTYVNLTVKTESICSNDNTQTPEPVGQSVVHLRKTSPTPSEYIGNGYTDSATGSVTFSQVLAQVGSTVYQYRLKVRDRINNKWEFLRNQSFSSDTTLTIQFPQTCDTTTGSGSGSGSGS